MNLKNFLAFALLIVAFVAMSIVSAYGSPPAHDRAQPAVVQTQAADSMQVSPIIVEDIDSALAMPIERVTVPGEKAKAARHERRNVTRADSLYQDWISEVPTPPNKTAEITDYNGFANTRAREQV